MSVHARAPVRIDFAGGWSDVPEYADVHGGAVVNAAITLHVHVECRVGGESYRFRSNDVGESVTLHSPSDIDYDGKLDLHKAALNMMPVTGGVEIVTASDVPAGSGLGASGSLDVALLRALSLCRREELAAADLAELGYQLETKELKLVGGRQDQYAAALGGFHEMTFGHGQVELVPIDLTRDACDELGKHATLVYTGQSHFSSETHQRVWAAFREGVGGVKDAIDTMRDLVAPLARALRDGDWREVGRLVDENWVQQRRLDATISTPETERIAAAVREAGAWGIKATGAGAGGSLIILGPADRQSEIGAAAEARGGRVLPWAFDLEGVTGWVD